MLDSVRAIAATTVFFRHAGIQLGLTGTAAAFAEHMNLGLIVFFVLSGFLLYRPFARAAFRGTSVDLGRYAIGRLLRIVPAYWVALTAVLLIGSTVPLGEAVRLYGFAQIYDTDTILSGIGQAWTLDVEMTFYALLPAVAFVLGRLPVASQRGRLWLALGFLILAFIASELFKVWYLGNQVYADHGLAWISHTLLWFGDAFIAGMAVALLLEWRSLKSSEPGRTRIRRAWPYWTAAALLYIAHALFDQDLDVGYRPIVANLMDVVAASLIFLPAVSRSLADGPAKRFLLSTPATYLGVVSYSFYLLHYLVLSKVVPFDSGWAGLPLVGVAFVLACLVGWGSWYLVERPALMLRDRLVPRQPDGARSVHSPGGTEAQAAP